MLGKLQKSSMAAKKEADIVNEIKKGCEEEAHKIALEKADAEKDLAKAMPFVEEAERPANSPELGVLTRGHRTRAWVVS